MKLKDVETGSKCRVAGYQTDDRSYRKKLLQMGLVRGAEFIVVRIAPLGDPVEIQLSGFNLTLRRQEADAIDVELVEGGSE